MPSFWNNLPKPIFCLAPMEEVTDVAFREIFARYSGIAERSGPIYGRLNNADESASARAERDGSARYTSRTNNFVMFTEFVNVDGLLHPQGYEKLKIDLEYSEAQRPIVAQIWGTDPEKFYRAARLIVTLGFDGIDINMGCPQDKEIGIGACAALIRYPELAKEIISATKRGAGDLPVSVKTRLGYSKPEEMEGWLTTLLVADLAAISIHARTKQEKSKVPARWDKIAEAVQIRNEKQKNSNEKTLIIGNGDVKSRAEGLLRIQETGCDGVMIARGAFGFPWLFREDDYQPTIKERLSVMLEHAQLFQDKLGGHKSFFIMRKHFKAYASGFEGSHELRAQLMAAKSLEETKEIVKGFLKIN